NDPLVPVTGGIDTHENIPGAELLLIEGMGHDLPMAAWSQMVEAITGLTTRAHR
ncbi:MAG: alpha/beta hydrolase, partial [Proteobacteria bacterium]|nr:alpha/beta hydrolase [Pseudomonadota bacterium]